MDNHQSSAAKYRLFCQIVCPGLVLIGLFLLAISIRISQFTCQRSSGQCTITHLGILPTPKITFELGYLGRALVEQTEYCCTSDTPVWYNLTIESGGLKKSYRLLYAWVNRETANALLKPAVVNVTEFMRDPTIPDVTIRLPDNRREDLYCGIYFLVIGIVYTRINARVIFSRRLASHLGFQPDEIGSAVDSRLMAAALPGDIVPKKIPFWYPIWIWLGWSFFPWISVILCMLAFQYYLNSLLPMGATAFGLLGMAMCLLLAYFTTQAWIIHRLGISGFRWIATCIVGVIPPLIFGFLFMLLARTDQPNFLGQAYSQGRLSIFGLIFGSLMGLFQAFALKSRVAYASWWVLSSALVSEILIVIPQIGMILFPQIHSLVETINRLRTPSPVYNSILVFLFCFSAIKGVIFVWMVLKTQDLQPAEIH